MKVFFDQVDRYWKWFYFFIQMLLNICAQSLNLCYNLSILFAIVVYDVINSLDMTLYDKTCNKYNALSRPFMTSIMVYCLTYYIMVSIVSLPFVLHVYLSFVYMTIILICLFLLFQKLVVRELVWQQQIFYDMKNLWVLC